MFLYSAEVDAQKKQHNSASDPYKNFDTNLAAFNENIIPNAVSDPM